MGVFAFLIWIFGLLVVVFWMVSDDLVVGTCIFRSWWLFFLIFGGGFDGYFFNGWW